MSSTYPPLENNPAIGLLQQFKQLSVPLWARSLALCLGVATFVAGLWLLWMGSVNCGDRGNCGNVLDTGVRIVTTSFVPVIVLVYLVFAQTGVSALTRKSRELLATTIPEALRTKHQAGDLSALTDEIAHSDVELTHHRGAPTAHYRLTLSRGVGTGMATAHIRFLVDFNVTKMNVVVFIPCIDPPPAEPGGSWLARHFPVTCEGARHEGYEVDQSMSYVTTQAVPLLKICLRHRLANDFLWDPAAKLYFAQDLRYFLFSLAEEGWNRFSTTQA